MRLAIVEPQPFGGLLHYAVQLGDAVAQRGHSVDLLTARGNELAGRRGPATMRAVLAPPLRTPPAPARTRLGAWRRRAGVAWRLVRTWARIARESARGPYDAVLIGSDIDLAPIAALLLGITAVPRRPRLLYVAHSVRPYNRWGGDELHSRSRVLIGLLRRLLPRFDMVFVHGARSRAEFEASWPPTRLAEIPHGDERLFAGEPPPPSDEERVLFFGDWRKVKGLPVLMAAFDRLLARRPDARLTIAGTPSEIDGDPEAVRRWAAGHGDRVRVIDAYVPTEDVLALFATARVVVTPYLVGYQSGVVHLAMTMARAVVTSDVGDLPEAVGDGGLVVPPGDAVALADALGEVLSDPERAEALGARGRARMLDRASWDKVAEILEGHLATLGAA